MKCKKLFLLLFIPALMGSCKKIDNSLNLPSELTEVKNKIQLSMDSLNNQLSTTAASLVQSQLDSLTIRNNLISLYAGSSFSKEFAYINGQYMMQMLEPPQYYQYQGADFSSSSDFVRVFQTKQPFLTNLFHALEGFDAVANIYPMVKNSEVIGAIESVFSPADMMGRIIKPVIENKAFDIWVLDMNGALVYDQDPNAIGDNILEDSVYVDFPELRTAVHEILSGEKGEVSYSYYWPGTSTYVNKKGYWDTMTINGNSWKIVWVKADL
jgi:hypothetical protein